MFTSINVMLLTVMRHGDGHLALAYIEQTDRADDFGRYGEQLGSGLAEYGVRVEEAARVGRRFLLDHSVYYQHHSENKPNGIHINICLLYTSRCV